MLAPVGHSGDGRRIRLRDGSPRPANAVDFWTGRMHRVGLPLFAEAGKSGSAGPRVVATSTDSFGGIARLLKEEFQCRSFAWSWRRSSGFSV